MLAKRVVTALVLLAILVPALLAPSPWPFQLLTLVLIAAAGWEWARLQHVAMGGALLFGAGVVAACLVLWLTVLAASSSLPPAFWLGWALGWCVAIPLAFSSGPAQWRSRSRLSRLLAGYGLLVSAWVAIAQARSGGVNFILSVMALVWAADISAYLFGRLFGRRKLAPTISPGKTWEGAVGGLAGVLALAWLWSWADLRWGFDGPSLYTQLLAQGGWPVATLLLTMLTGFSVTGDLFESLVKRAAGAKDSSALLPGHGGVLDRIDALLPVAPAALAALALVAALSGMGAKP